MPKLYLNTMNKQEVIEFGKAHIYAKRYNAKIQPNSTHVPVAAKIIISNVDGSMLVFIMEMPLVLCDHDGNINIYTQTSYELATLKDLADFMKNNIKIILKEELNSIRAKKVFGLLPEEIIHEKQIQVKLEMHRIIDSLDDIKDGGGFHA